MRKKQQEEAQEEAGELWHNPMNLVFTTRYGTPIEPGNLSRMFPARSRHAGVRAIHLHDTRHTCASLLVALDVHPRVAMAILRHSQISMTMEIYSHVTDEQTRDALRRLGALLTTSPTMAVAEAAEAALSKTRLPSRPSLVAVLGCCTGGRNLVLGTSRRAARGPESGDSGPLTWFVATWRGARSEGFEPPTF
jgi:hypothetical protein